MQEQKKKWLIQSEEERSFLELPIEMTDILGKDQLAYRRWTFKEIYEQVSQALQLDLNIRTMNDYKQWRASLEAKRGEYPSVETIWRLTPSQYTQIQDLFTQGRVGRPLKWSEERVWECLKAAYQQSRIEGCPFSPQYYRQWQHHQAQATPSYSTINELIGSFKMIRQQLEVRDGRFEQGSTRPKRWTEDLVWGFLEAAYQDLRGKNLDFTQQTFIQWREEQLKQDVKIPSLTTIKTVLGGGGFAAWKKRFND